LKITRAGIVLAGGVGMRLGPGKPKGLRSFAGSTLFDRSLALLATRAERVYAAVPHDFPLPPSFGCERIDDLAYLAGPLAGLVPALEHAALAKADIVWVVPVDMPFLRPEHLDTLAYALDSPDGPNAAMAVVPPAAVVPRTARGIEPLLGAYRPTYAAPVLRAAWNRGERSAARALSEMGGRMLFLDIEKDGAWPGGLDTLAGTNTPEEWTRAEERILGQPGS
jgi:molybdopterin-guanine dinucleotide biosynthesis protein A